VKAKIIACLPALGILLLFSTWSCQENDDDDDDHDTADDNNPSPDGDDDDTTGDDDDDDDTAGDDDEDDDDAVDDDDSNPVTSAGIAASLENIGHRYIPDLEFSWEDWCNLAEAFFTEKLRSPFFKCLTDYVFVADCDSASYDACNSPPDPGGAGCGHVTHGIYACGVVFVYDIESEYFIPEMDAMAACNDQLRDWPWACFSDCMAPLTCSEPPTNPESVAMADCCNSCWETSPS